MSRIFRVTGPPGTGKTTYLAAQAQRAAEAYGPSNVAIASLTRTAAAEIAGRDTPVPDANVGTLHAHCYSALECERDDMAEIAPSMREFAAAHPELDIGTSGAGDDALDDELASAYADNIDNGTHAAVMNHRARMTPREQWTDEERAYDEAWADFKRQTERLDFTDLIETCLREHDTHPAHPRALLLDEAQDFSALEMALAVKWSHATETTVIVGDPDQALYGWRGSDAGTLDTLQVAGDRLLAQSYRCPRAVRDVALDWISQIPGRRDVRWEPTDEHGEVHQAPYALRDRDDLVAELEDLDGSVMILASCGYMLDPLLRELREQGIPFGNPHRTKGRSGAAWNPMRSPGVQALAHYLRTSEAVWGERAGMRTWGDLLAWTEPIQARGYLARGAKAAIEEHCRTDQFGVNRSGDPVPLPTLVELLGSATHPALRGDVDWWRSALLSRHQRGGEYAVRIWRRDPAALLREPNVVVGTIHSVKGGEADHVLISPELSKEGFWEGWHGTGRAAVVRMMYVALTRARRSVRVLESAVPECVPLELEQGRLAA